MRGGGGGFSSAVPAGKPSSKEAVDPLAEAEEALKRLRQNPNDKQAAQDLERALKQFKEQGKAQKK
jgi:hypothetical protein